MANNPYTVIVVVNRDFGKRLLELPPGVPVWIVDTPTNQAAAQRVRAERPTESHLQGVTTFKIRDEESGEDSLIYELDSIDLHHGWYSAPTPYTVLEIIGTQLTDRVKIELSQYGFDEFQSTTEGFRALRPLPPDDRE